MNKSCQRVRNITIQIANMARERGLVDQPYPWSSDTQRTYIRFHDVLDGDIPLIAEVSNWRGGTCDIRWVLWPKTLEVSLDGLFQSCTWPGDVWGTAYVDRQWSCCLFDGRFHCRRDRRLRLDAIAEAPLHSCMTSRF